MLENKDQSKTNLEQFGEFGLIEHLTKNFTIKQKSTVKGFGDDAAVLNFESKKTVIATELFVEGVHFDLAYMPLKHLGYKSIITSISSICAMNATATQSTISIAVSNRFPLEALEELFEGVAAAAQIYDIDIIGGQTTSSQKGLIISITTIGEVNKEVITYRNTAQISDLLVVSGDIGAAYMGLQILEREKQVFQVNPNNQPDLEPYTYLIERQLKPEARKDLKELFQKLELQPTAMISVKNGLSTEILQLCKQSNVGCNLYEEKIPVDPQLINVCEEFNLDITTIALNGGEDFELLFTIKIDDFGKIKANPNFTVIGHITQSSEGIHLITRANTKIELKARGWKTND